MGCCLSAAGDQTEPRRSIDGAPPTSPPGVLEEETVKEVLLETPVVPKTDERIEGVPPENPEWKAETGLASVTHGNSDRPGKDKEEIVSEVSEVSEISSYSESFSNATAIEKKDNDEDGVVNQRPPPRKRRAHGGGQWRGQRGVASRTTAPSSEKRGQVAPLRPDRGRPMMGQPQNMGEENGRRRDALEGSGRVSTLPMKGCEVGAPRNVSDEKTPATEEPPKDVVPSDEVESLENPVVSLECFIFL